VRDVEASGEARVDTVTLPVVRTLLDVAVADVNGNPLSQVSLEVRSTTGPARRAVTGRNGRAMLEDLATGPLEVNARRLGFRPGRVAASIELGRNLLPIVMSEVSAPVLDTVHVVESARTLARLQEFDSRRLSRQATVSITREDIVKRNPADAWQMLTNVPSMKIVDVDTMVIARSTRTTIANFKNDYCFMLVMVDGVLMNKDSGHKAFDLRFLPPPEDIYGIEVFAGGASMPLQYGGTGEGKWCGMIAIWTR